ncbi:MAG: hypothetical protein Q7K54_05940 [Candidatus Parcubacteria bacterium]|nr:hypothetical protein [Candidatus Parcubacteria bacterium]
MNTKKINQLVLSSFSNLYLQEKKVKKIASLLDKSDLKKYINGLRRQEMKKSLIVATPMNNNDKGKFTKLFPNKKIIFKRDPSLMLGVKIVDNDMIYEFTLRNSLDKILNYIEQNYD